MKMKQKTLTCLAAHQYHDRHLPSCLGVVLVTMLVSITLNAMDMPAVDTRFLEVEIVAPRTDLLLSEKVEFEVVLRNAGTDAIPIGLPLANEGLRYQGGCQLFLEPIWRDRGAFPNSMREIQGMYSSKLPAKAETAPWPPRDFLEDDPIEAVAWLPPGYRIVWHENRIDERIFGIAMVPQLEGIKARWLAGPGSWIDSNTLDLNIHEWNPVTDSTVIFEGKWSTGSSSTRSARLVKVATEGKYYLFYNRTGYIRLSEIGEKEEVEVRIDEAIPQLMVQFPASGRPAVYVHLKEGRASSIPWQAGPSSLFTPKPMPMGEQELMTVRARLGLTANGKLAIKGSIPASLSGDKQSDPIGPLRSQELPLKNPFVLTYIEIMLFAAVLVVLGLLLRSARHNRKRSSSNIKGSGKDS